MSAESRRIRKQMATARKKKHDKPSTFNVGQCINFIANKYGIAEAARCCFRLDIDDVEGWRNEVFRLTGSSLYDPHKTPEHHEEYRLMDDNAMIVHLARELHHWKTAHHNVAYTKRLGIQWKAKLLKEKNDDIAHLQARIQELEGLTTGVQNEPPSL